jgi:NADH-quinone oxidoreductase subunit H
MINLLTIDWILLLEKLILIAIIVSVSLVVAMYETYAERKIAAFMQDRIGPNRAGTLWHFTTAGRWRQIILQRRDHSQPFQ